MSTKIKTKDAAVLGLVVGACATTGALAAYQASKWVEAGVHKIKDKIKEKKEEKKGNAVAE